MAGRESVTKERPGNHHILDFGGAIEILGHFGAREVSGEGAILPEAIGPERLHTLRESIKGDSGGKFFSVGGANSHRWITCIERGGCGLGERERGFEVGRDIREHPLETLTL